MNTVDSKDTAHAAEAAELPTSWRNDWARELAAPPQTVNARGQRRRWMVFGLGGQRLALPARDVARSHSPAPGHALPGRSTALVRRLTQLEGRLVLTADLFSVFGLTPATHTAPKRVLELATTTQPYALPVDDVLAIVDLEDAQVDPVPVHLSAAGASLLCGIWHGPDGVTVGMVDPVRLADRLDADLG